MARTVDLTTLLRRVRWRTDTEAETTRFPDSELTDAVNEGIAKLHSRVVRLRGQGQFESTTTVTTTASTELYSLPAFFLEVVKVYTLIDGVERVLTPYEFVETDGYSDSVSWQSMTVRPQFRLRGDNISFRPIPDAEYTVTLVYVPTAVKLVAPADTLDGVDGLEEYVVAWAAKRVALKQRDPELAGMLDAEMARALEEIDGLCQARNAAMPPRMTDVRRLSSPMRWHRRWMR